MSDLQYRPRSVTEIIDAAFQLYRQDALRYILITAVAYAPMLVFQLVFLDPANVSLASGLFGFASYVVGFFAFALMSAALVRLSAEAYLGRDMEIGTALTEVLPRVPSILGATLIRVILIFVTALALIIPGLWMFARTFALTPILVLERADVATALNRSAQLSNGRKRAILGCYALTFLIFYVVTLAFGFVAAIVGGGILFTLITTIATVVIYPVIGIMEMVLYYDSRIRAEGYDVELMANALGTPIVDAVVPIQAADSLTRWPASTIHDTVSAIVQQTVYQRRLGRSLAERFWSWFADQLSALFNAVAGTPAARTTTLLVCGLLVAAIVLRFLVAARSERYVSRATGPSGARAGRYLPTLDDARKLAREGRYADAMHVLYAAVLDVLAQRRLVRLHASKTSGDFARELSARGHPAQDAFRAFVRRFDRLLYGYDVCDAAAFDSLWGEAERVLRVAQSSGST